MSEFKILGKIDLDVFDKRNIEQEIFDEMEEDDFPTAHGDEQMLQEEQLDIYMQNIEDWFLEF